MIQIETHRDRDRSNTLTKTESSFVCVPRDRGLRRPEFCVSTSTFSKILSAHSDHHPKCIFRRREHVQHRTNMRSNTRCRSNQPLSVAVWERLSQVSFGCQFSNFVFSTRRQFFCREYSYFAPSSTNFTFSEVVTASRVALWTGSTQLVLSWISETETRRKFQALHRIG